MIRLSGIGKTYTMGDESVQALRGVDLHVPPGEFLAIMGTSGSGKSTLMNILGCLDRPTMGSYHLDGSDVSKLNDDQLARVRGHKIGFVFQSFNLISLSTSVDNVLLPLLYAGDPKAREKALRALDRVGLAQRANHKPNELSGGQRQRVAIARALVSDPSIILADEPTGNLDTRTGDEILELFKELHDNGSTIVMVTHERDVAEHAQRIVTFRDGLLVEDEWLDKSPSPLVGSAAPPALSPQGGAS